MHKVLIAMKHTMKHLTPVLLLAALCLAGCNKKSDTMDCKIYWQLYLHTKQIEPTDIEKAFQETFFGFYERVNDNTVLARNTTKADVRSLTLKLCSMADSKITDELEPALDCQAEMRVYIDFNGAYVEEIWSKKYTL